MRLAHDIYNSMSWYDENFDMSDALKMAWRDAKRGRRLIDSDTLEGQRSEYASARRESYLLNSRGL